MRGLAGRTGGKGGVYDDADRSDETRCRIHLVSALAGDMSLQLQVRGR